MTKINSHMPQTVDFRVPGSEPHLYLNPVLFRPHLTSPPSHFFRTLPFLPFFFQKLSGQFFIPKTHKQTEVFYSSCDKMSTFLGISSCIGVVSIMLYQQLTESVIWRNDILTFVVPYLCPDSGDSRSLSGLRFEDS